MQADWPEETDFHIENFLSSNGRDYLRKKPNTVVYTCVLHRIPVWRGHLQWSLKMGGMRNNASIKGFMYINKYFQIAEEAYLFAHKNIAKFVTVL